MQVFLLAAGFGTRVRPISETYPKPLFPVLNMPAIEYLLRYFSSFGIKNFTINTHHLAALLEDKVKKAYLKDLKISFSREEKILGTGGGIKRMTAKTPQRSDTIIISNSDSIYNFDLDHLIETHWKSANPVSLVLTPYKSGCGYTGITVDKSGLIEKFGSGSQSPRKNHKVGIFTGLHIMSRKLLPAFPDRDVFCIVEDYYKNLLAKGIKIGGIFARGDWLDIGDIRHYYNSNLKLLRSYRDFPALAEWFSHNYHEPRKGIFIHKKTRFLPDSRFVGPCVVGENVRIGSNCKFGPGSIIGNGITIGDLVSLSNSVVFDDTVVHSGTKLTKVVARKNLFVKVEQKRS